MKYLIGVRQEESEYTEGTEEGTSDPEGEIMVEEGEAPQE